jgi:hypothetical protein
MIAAGERHARKERLKREMAECAARRAERRPLREQIIKIGYRKLRAELRDDKVALALLKQMRKRLLAV